MRLAMRTIRSPLIRSRKRRTGSAIAGQENQWDIQFQLRGRDLTDDGLADVARLGNVVELNLRDTKITSAGLVHLKGLAKLTRLHLERTNVGDEGIANLTKLTTLEYLNLYGTKITDKSLDHWRAEESTTALRLAD